MSGGRLPSPRGHASHPFVQYLAPITWEVTGGEVFAENSPDTHVSNIYLQEAGRLEWCVSKDERITWHHPSKGCSAYQRAGSVEGAKEDKGWPTILSAKGATQTTVLVISGFGMHRVEDVTNKLATCGRSSRCISWPPYTTKTSALR